MTIPPEELAWSHINRADEHVRTGEEHYTYVKSVDVENTKLEGSLRLPKEDSFEMVLNKYKTNGEYKTQITGIKEFGIFVEFEQGVQGLCPITNCMNFSRGLGDVVLVQISRINANKK